MESDSQSLAVAQEEVRAPGDARWGGIRIQDTERLNRYRFSLVWEKSEKHYEKDLKIGDNDLSVNPLYQGNKLTIEITNNFTSSKFYIHTLPGNLKDSKYAYEDLSIAFSTDANSQTRYEYFYLCPWSLQERNRWLQINERNLVMRVGTQSTYRGIDIDWKYPFIDWLDGKFESITRSIDERGYAKSFSRSIKERSYKPLKYPTHAEEFGYPETRQDAFTPTLGMVKEYDWPEGFTVWLKTVDADEERIDGQKEVNIALTDKPTLVIKKKGRQVALIWSQDEGCWELGVCWNVDQTRTGTVKHVYAPPYDEEGNKHDLYVSPLCVTLYSHPHAYPHLSPVRGIVADISKDLGIWMVEDELVVAEGSSGS